MTGLPTLYHFTCDHGRDVLGEAGELVPGRMLTQSWDVPWPCRFLWMTDMPVADRDKLGLTMRLVKCDRTAYRYRVTDARCVLRWTDLVDSNPFYGKVAHELLTPGADPARWFVSLKPVPAIFDPAQVSA